MLSRENEFIVTGAEALGVMEVLGDSCWSEETEIRGAYCCCYYIC